MSHFAYSRLTGARRQQGAIIFFAAIAMSVIVIALSLADIGFLYYYKREYQKAADLAAMAGAKQLSTGCNAAIAAATQSVTHNIGGLSHDAPTVEVGVWMRDAQPRFVARCEEGSNAVRVRITGGSPRFLLRLTDGQTQLKLSVDGIATSGDPVATFSVGTRLAALGGPSVVGNVLKAVGIDTGLDLMSYNGLAGVTITPGGLLEALGIPISTDLTIADFNALLAAEEVTLGALLDATATLVGQDELLASNTQLLQALSVPLDLSLDDIVVQLGSDQNGRGLFAEITSPMDAALNVGLDALDLVSTAITIASSGRGIDVALNGLDGLSALAGANLTVKVGVIEPPSIAIGGVGTKAYSAQTRVYAHLSLDTAGLLGGLGAVLAPLARAQVDLPLVIDVASATGTLEELCTPALRDVDDPPACPGGEDCADISVDAQIAKVCLGGINAGTIFSTTDSCDIGLTNTQVVNVSLLGSSLIGLNTHLAADALATEGSVVLAAGQLQTVDGELNLGTTISNVVQGLLAAVIGQSLDQGDEEIPSDSDEQMAEELWGDTPCGSRSCRVARIADVQEEIEESVAGLQGFLGGLTGDVLNLVGDLLTLDVIGLLSDVGSLLGGVLDLVGDLLGGLIGGCTALIGSNDAACISDIEDMLEGTSGSGSSTTSNALIVLVGFLLEVLEPVLNALGDLLNDVLNSVLGLQIGQTDIDLMALECREGAVLVE